MSWKRVHCFHILMLQTALFFAQLLATARSLQGVSHTTFAELKGSPGGLARFRPGYWIQLRMMVNGDVALSKGTW
jgi:hypothetical protein